MDSVSLLHRITALSMTSGVREHFRPMVRLQQMQRCRLNAFDCLAAGRGITVNEVLRQQRDVTGTFPK